MIEKIICHPNNVRFLTDHVEHAGIKVGPFSIPVYVDRNLPEFVQKWEFPKDRFVEYGPEDEYWARPLGFGRLVDTAERYFVVVNMRIWSMASMYAMPLVVPSYMFSWCV